ncbi:hypothetical protein L5515_018605 [Caenorhabditis briggsae]|uniref:Uncharacterized protein n=2 Tax=Caenorhabditis briggsae TaxID=6238 RepID=A0AAE9FHD2_CAEBR|nr:hypothetical protein L5515_018605 [Caenorhabditis briggsae]
MESKKATVFQLHCQLEMLGEKIVNSFHGVPKKGHPAYEDLSQRNGILQAILDSVAEMVHCGLCEENVVEAQKMVIEWSHYLKNQSRGSNQHDGILPTKTRHGSWMLTNYHIRDNDQFSVAFAAFVTSYTGQANHEVVNQSLIIRAQKLTNFFKMGRGYRHIFRNNNVQALLLVIFPAKRLIPNVMRMLDFFLGNTVQDVLGIKCVHGNPQRNLTDVEIPEVVRIQSSTSDVFTFLQFDDSRRQEKN